MAMSSCKSVVDQFSHNQLVCRVNDHVHPAHPFHLIKHLHVLIDSLSFSYLPHYKFMTSTCLFVKVGKVGLQLAAQEHGTVQAGTMILDIVHPHHAPLAQGAMILLFLVDDVEQVVIAIQRVVQTVAVVMDVHGQVVDLVRDSNEPDIPLAHLVNEGGEGGGISGDPGDILHDDGVNLTGLHSSPQVLEAGPCIVFVRITVIGEMLKVREAV